MLNPEYERQNIYWQFTFLPISDLVSLCCNFTHFRFIINFIFYNIQLTVCLGIGIKNTKQALGRRNVLG